MLLLTDKDVARCVAALDLTIGMLQKDRQIAQAQRDETVGEMLDTRRKLVAASVRAATDAAKILRAP